jgi:hypothetical protein
MNKDAQVDILSRAIDALFVTRSQLAESMKVDDVILNETIDRSARAMVLCLDLRSGTVNL